MNNTATRTLTSTARGESVSAGVVVAGDYIWHNGAFRLVTEVVATFYPTIRMGRYSLRSRYLVERAARP